MSWVQWHGGVWPTTDDEATLRVFLGSPDTGRARQEWYFDLMHLVRDPAVQPVDYDTDQALFIRLEQLQFARPDWRELSGWTIRADAAWHATQEGYSQHGYYHSPRVMVGTLNAPEGPGRQGTNWVAHDFTLRMGQRDGLVFPCELDAWMVPEEEYWRKEPEAAEEVARFGEGPPNLRVITRVQFDGGTVELTRGVGDPLVEARRRLRSELGVEEIHEETLKWALRSTPDHEKIVDMPGWRSSVHFQTKPWTAQERTPEGD